LENAARWRCRICFRAMVRFFARATDLWAVRGAGRRARRVADCPEGVVSGRLENEARALIYLRATGDRFARATALAGATVGVCWALHAKSCAALRTVGD
jgi:hypothetical protein